MNNVRVSCKFCGVSKAEQSAEVERLSKERDDVLDILWRDIDDLRDPKLTVVQVAAKAAKGRDKEIAAWQDAIYKVCVKAAVKAGFPDYTIDGGGSDGDELTFTLAEIEQAINCVQEAAESKLSQKCADYERLREALEKLRDGFTTGDYVNRIASEALAPPPAAGIPEEADAGVVARKSEESSSGGRK